VLVSCVAFKEALFRFSLSVSKIFISVEPEPDVELEER
jgi:hypothetical protein